MIYGDKWFVSYWLTDGTHVHKMMDSFSEVEGWLRQEAK